MKGVKPLGNKTLAGRSALDGARTGVATVISKHTKLGPGPGGHKLAVAAQWRPMAQSPR
jgi:hypothetical protein